MEIKAKTIPTPRFLRRPSVKNSFNPTEGRSSKNYGADQQRLQISYIHFDKFPTHLSFSCWKIRFKNWGMFLFKFLHGSNAMDQRCGDDWFSGRPRIFVFFSRVHSFSWLRVARREDCICPEQNHPAFLLQEKGQSGGTESSKNGPNPSRETDRSLDLRLLPGTDVNESVLDYADLCAVALPNDDIREFETRRDEILLSTKQFPPDDVLKCLYKLRIRESEKLKTVLDL